MTNQPFFENKDSGTLGLRGLREAFGDAGGSFGAIDLVRVDKGTKVRDVTVEATDADHMARIVEGVRSVDGIEVERVSDRTFLMHLGGKIEMRSKVPVKTRDDLSMAYTPGVARICQAIAADRDSAWNLTIKQNTVAVVSDGTAVLGLGDIGPEAAMPVMEGKAMLFKEFAGVDAFPICIDAGPADMPLQDRIDAIKDRRALAVAASSRRTPAFFAATDRRTARRSCRRPAAPACEAGAGLAGQSSGFR